MAPSHLTTTTTNRERTRKSLPTTAVELMPAPLVVVTMTTVEQVTKASECQHDAGRPHCSWLNLCPCSWHRPRTLNTPSGPPSYWHGSKRPPRKQSKDPRKTGRGSVRRMLTGPTRITAVQCSKVFFTTGETRRVNGLRLR